MPTDYTAKLEAIRATDGDLEKAKAIYAWFMAPADAQPTDAVKPADAVQPKTTKPKAEKPAEPAKEPAKAPPSEKESPGANAGIKLSYDTDVLPEILAALNRLTTAGASTDDGKAAIVKMMSSNFGVTNAKEVKPERWAELVATLKQMGE